MKQNNMAGTAKKRASMKNVIVAVAAVTGATIAQEAAAARAALADMKAEFGTDAVYGISYEYDPFDGLLA